MTIENEEAATPSISHTNVGEGAPAPIGHYSHATELENGLIYLSGQKAWDPHSGQLISGGIEEQTNLVFSNIAAILAGIGLDFSSVTRISCHLSDVHLYEAFNKVYAERLGPCKPARTVLAGYALRGGALVELVAEAYRAPSSKPATR